MTVAFVCKRNTAESVFTWLAYECFIWMCIDDAIQNDQTSSHRTENKVGSKEKNKTKENILVNSFIGVLETEWSNETVAGCSIILIPDIYIYINLVI